jgi:hypothetical protein
VIIECLRGNPALCANKVPRDLLEDFGTLLNACPDPSTSPLLAFFGLLCQPGGADQALDLNQVHVADVLLAPRLATLKACFDVALGAVDASDAEVPCAAPEKLVELVAQMLALKNVRTATMLQNAGYTMDLLLMATFKRVQALGLLASSSPHPAQQGTSLDGLASEPPPPCPGGMLGDPLCKSLTKVLCLTMQALVIDPRIFRKDAIWQLTCVAGKEMLQAFVAKKGWGSQDDDFYAAFGMLGIIKLLLMGAKALVQKGSPRAWANTL